MQLADLSSTVTHSCCIRISKPVSRLVHSIRDEVTSYTAIQCLMLEQDSVQASVAFSQVGSNAHQAEGSWGRLQAHQTPALAAADGKPAVKPVAAAAAAAQPGDEPWLRLQPP